MSEPTLDEILVRIEVPDCDCPRPVYRCTCATFQTTGDCDCERLPLFSPACPHMLAKAEDPVFRVVDMEWWASALYALQPRQYADRPLPPPALTAGMSQEARVAILAKRRRLSQALFHPDDLGKNGLPVQDLSVKVKRGRNGRAYEDGIVSKVA
jgi:hypothetical protein